MPLGAPMPVLDIDGVRQVARQIGETTAQVKQMKQQVAYLKDSLKLLRPRSYGNLLSTINRNLANYDSISRQLTGLGYSIERVNQRYRQLFPEEQDVASASPAQHAAMAAQVNSEVREATLASMRAQSTIDDLANANAATQSILAQSRTNRSQVAQIQLAMQMLTVLDQNLQGIIRTVSTAGRVASNKAAADVTRRRISREKKRRALEGYVPQERPVEVDRRFMGNR